MHDDIHVYACEMNHPSLTFSHVLKLKYQSLSSKLKIKTFPSFSEIALSVTNKLKIFS